MEADRHCDGCHTRTAATQTLSTPRYYFCSVECAEHNWKHLSARAPKLRDFTRRLSQRRRAHKTSPRTTQRVLYLLNHYTDKAKTRAALALLAQHFSVPEPRVQWVACAEFVPGSSDGETIFLCDRAQRPEFQDSYAPGVRYDAARVTHYAIVVLHEFAHIFQPGWSEGRVDEWVQAFIDGA